MSKTKLYTTYAVVKGRGMFPFDMLRYDACYPNSQEDSSEMAYYPGDNGYRVVVLARKDSKISDWTPGRWASFGWSVEGVFD